MFNLNELDVFVKAAETCNFSAAARSLHMSQPAVSLLIRSLERKLRTPLFRRNGRSVTLTEAGRILAPLAKDLLVRARRAEEAVASLQGEVVGDLVIACSTTSGKYVLPQLVAGFRSRHSQVVARIAVTDQSAAIRMVLEGVAHLAVTSTRMDPPDLESQPFFTDPIVLIVPRAHRWARNGRVRPGDLLNEQLLLREASSGTRKALLDGLAAHGIRLEHLSVAMELGNAEAIEMAVEAGLGISFVSFMAATKGIELGRVAMVPVDSLELERSLFLVRTPRHAATRAQMAFCEYATAIEQQQHLQRMVALPSSGQAQPASSV